MNAGDGRDMRRKREARNNGTGNAGEGEENETLRRGEKCRREIDMVKIDVTRK